MKNIIVDMEYRINDGRWHTVNIEINIMEVMVMVDRKGIKNIQDQTKPIVKDTSYIVSEVKVKKANKKFPLIVGIFFRTFLLAILSV